MPYFYDYFAKGYRDRHKEGLLPVPAAMFRGIRQDVQGCRRALKNAFAGYRGGRNAEVLKRLVMEYREYISGCHDEGAKERYNAFAYRYMVGEHIGSRAIAAKMGVVKETVCNYTNRCIDEMLVLCMGIPAAEEHLGTKERVVRTLAGNSKLLQDMAGEYVLLLFPDRRQGQAVERGREITGDALRQFAGAVEAYLDYCRDGHTRIDTDIRRAWVLERCIDGISPAAIAEEYGCCESTVYADIRENERRLAAMLFVEGRGVMDGAGK